MATTASWRRTPLSVSWHSVGPNQTPTFDPAEPEPVPDFDFDQSLPDDFDP